MRKLVLATRNKGKVRELRELLAGLAVTVEDLDSYPGAPEVAETGTTFTENAILKSKGIAAFSGELTLADDSGLEVDWLRGEPGVYSARYGEAGWTDRQRYEYLLTKLEGVPEPQRTGRFRSVAALVDPARGIVEVTEGEVAGVIAFGPRRDNGFGYDPVFYLPDFGCTMAELSEETKNRISHRGRALRNMLPRISTCALPADASQTRGISGS